MAEHSEKEDHSHGSSGHSSGGGHGGGGGGHEEGEHEGAPEWLISFADNVTLMMGFFVILLAITMAQVSAKAGTGEKSEDPSSASTPTADMLDFAIAVRGAFNNPVDIYNPTPNPADLPLIRRVLERTQQGYTLREGFAGNEHDVKSPQRGAEPPEPAGEVQFDFQSSVLTDEARTHLTRVSEFFQGVRLILEVRGHASVQEASLSTDRGMSLSFQRAFAVADFLAAHGLRWEQLRLSACGDNERRRRTAYNREENAVNERVEIVPTDESIPQ